MKRLLFLLIGATTWMACQDDDNQTVIPPVPDDGIYITTQFDEQDIDLQVDVPYTTRPNYQGIQYTAGKRKALEAGLETLTIHMDVATPPNATAQTIQPLIIYIHGGSFSGGNKEDLRDQMISYAKAGYVAASINYRLTPDNQSSRELRSVAVMNAVEDAMNAIRFLKKNASVYHIDTTRIATIGSSAGGGITLSNAIGADELDLLSDYPGYLAKVQATISTGATLSADSLVDTSVLHFDAHDSPVLLFHNGVQDPVTGATWADAENTKSKIDASGNECTLVAQLPDTHTVNLSLGGKYWDEVKLFLWMELKLYENSR